MLMHNAVYWGDQPLLARGTRLGGVTRPRPTHRLPSSLSTPPPNPPCHPSRGHLFRASVLQSSHLLRLDGLMVGAVGLMGTRIAGVDVTAYKNNKLAFNSMLIQNKQALARTVWERVEGSSSTHRAATKKGMSEPKLILSFVVKNVEQHASVICSVWIQW